MQRTSNSRTAAAPSCEAEPLVIIGRRDRTHLRVITVNTREKFVVLQVYEGEVLHSSCHVHTETMKGYEVRHAVRHPTDVPSLDVRGTVRRLLSPKRFNTLLGIDRSPGPIDVLRCGVAVGGCTFFMREYADGTIVAVFDDGDRQIQSRATVDDWNALIDEWQAEDAQHGDALRVRIAQDFFSARAWIPTGVRIFGAPSRENH